MSLLCRGPGRTRNNRLAAIHSLYQFAALKHPEQLHTIGRVLAIPAKRYERNTVNYLNATEIKALLAAPDRTSWHGRRDHTLLLLAIQTGLRVSELIASGTATSPSPQARTFSPEGKAGSSARRR